MKSKPRPRRPLVALAAAGVATLLVAVQPALATRALSGKDHRVTPIPKGTYVYKITGGGSYTSDSTVDPYGSWSYRGMRITVDAASGSSQKSTRTIGEGGGYSAVSEQTLRYERNGIHLEHSRSDGTYLGAPDPTEGAEECDPTPSPLILPVAAKPGYQHHYTLTCVSDSGSITYQIAIDVLRRETLRIGGTPVATLVVRTDVKVAGGHGTELDWVVPSNGLDVKERESDRWRATTAGSHYRGQDSYRATLRSLTPR